MNSLPSFFFVSTFSFLSFISCFLQSLLYSMFLIFLSFFENRLTAKLTCLVNLLLTIQDVSESSGNVEDESDDEVRFLLTRFLSLKRRLCQGLRYVFGSLAYACLPNILFNHSRIWRLI
jgi:hypothetical protein